MSYDLIDRKDQRIDTIFKGLENMERMIDAIRTAPRPAFHSDYFLTDEELSKPVESKPAYLAGIPDPRCDTLLPCAGEKPFTKSQTYRKFLTTHIKDAGKNSDGYETMQKKRPRYKVVSLFSDSWLWDFRLCFLTIISSSYKPDVWLRPAAFRRFMSSSTFLSVTLA